MKEKRGGLESLDPNVFPLDAFLLTGNQTSSERLIRLKAPWKFDGESSNYPQSGFVSGRGWWIKLADGTLIQRSIPIPNPAFAVGTYLHQIAHVTMSWTLPISFNDIDYDAVGSFAYSASSGLSGYWGVHENSKTTAIVVGRATSPNNYPANTMYLRIIAIGRWKA